MVYYQTIQKAQCGDLILFKGKSSRISNLIANFTLSPWSHSGAVTRPNEITESTSLNGFTGVVRRSITEALETYDGAAVLLRLHDPLRTIFDERAALGWVDQQIGVPYDVYSNVALAGVDWFWFPQVRVKEDLTKLFCSELCTEFLKRSNVIGEMNASEVTPGDLWRMPLFPDDASHRIPLNEDGATLLRKKYGYVSWPDLP